MARRPTVQVHLPYNFSARDYQSRFMRYYDRGGRNGMWLWHRRAGKDLVALHEEGKLAMKHVGMYWHCLPSFAQARKAIWNNFNNSTGQRLLDSVFPREIIKSPVEFRPQGEMLIEFVNGSMLQLVGSDNIDSIVGAGPRHVTFSEYALCKPNSYDLVRPMLRESGGSVAFITTPRGKNHAWKVWETAGNTAGWVRDCRTLEDTGAWKTWRRDDTNEFFRSAQEVIDAEIAAGMQPSLADQEYRCDWTAALVGSIWGDLMAEIERTGRICDFQPSGRAVFVTYDLGKNDATAFWIWETTPVGVNVIAHYENHGKGLSHYFGEQDALMARLGLHLHTVWLPHDSTADTLVSDLSIEDQFIERYAVSKVKVVPRLSALDGIQAGRWLLQQDTRFHKRCEPTQGIEALKQYHYEFDEVTKAYSNRPEHDWSSHTADAFRYLAVSVRLGKMLTKERDLGTPDKPHGTSGGLVRTLGDFTMDDLWSWRDQDIKEQRRFR